MSDEQLESLDPARDPAPDDAADQTSDAAETPLPADDDAFVRSVLASAGGPATLPADVAGRLDAALAALPSYDALQAPESTTVGAADATPAATVDERGRSADVTPLVPRRRRVLGSLPSLAAAAAVVALVGAVAVGALRSDDTGDDATSLDAGGGTQQENSAEDQFDEVQLTASGTAYSATSIGEVVPTLLDEDTAASPSTTREVSPSVGGDDPTSPGAAPADSPTESSSVAPPQAIALVTDQIRLESCLSEVSGGAVVLAVDAGTFSDPLTTNGQVPAVAIVLRTDVVDVVEVFVVGSDCAAGNVSLLYFTTVAAP